jgi:uncharacterized protein
VLWHSTPGTCAPVQPLRDLGGAAAGLLVLIPAALAEEVGWRGYMLPRLDRSAPVTASALAGILHGLWHAPLILLTPFYHAEGAFALPRFLAALTLAGLIYGWLRLRSQSLWPVVIAHSAVNAWATLFTGWSNASPARIDTLAGESGFIAVLSYLLAALWLWRPAQASATGFGEAHDE